MEHYFWNIFSLFKLSVPFSVMHFLSLYHFANLSTCFQIQELQLPSTSVFRLLTAVLCYSDI